MFFAIIIMAGHSSLYPQNTSYTQLWNEVDIIRAINERWAGEIDLSSSFSNTPSESQILKTNTQRSAVVWGHYFPSSRWKVSSFLGYFYNQDVPDIGQYRADEWRLAVQGTYFFHKVGYTLSTDGRVEVRFLENAEGTFEDIYRYRQKLKFRIPLNSHVLRKGVVYVLASEEIVFRSKSKSEGLKYFDRNLFTVGGGYLFSDDIQLELTYVNVFIPRDDKNEVDNAVSITLSVNNLLQKVGAIFQRPPNSPAGED